MAAENVFKRYIEQTTEICELIAPQIRDVANADDYRDRLVENYERIGQLAVENNAILKENFYPAVYDGERLNPSAMEDLRGFSDILVDAYHLNNLDSTIAYTQARWLLMEADALDNDEARIRALDKVVETAYIMICITGRLVPVSDICFDHYRIGLSAAEKLLAYLEPSKFRQLSDEMKELIVINARYIRVVSEIDGVPGTEEQRELNLQRMKDALAMADDPFYLEQLPAYDWQLHRFRTLEYICSLTDMNNEKGYNEEQIAYINECTKVMRDLYEEADDAFKKMHHSQNIYLYCARNAFLAGELPLEDFKRAMEEVIAIDFRDTLEDEVPVVMLYAALEYMLVVDPENLTPAEAKCLDDFYKKLISYIHQTPKRGMLTFLLSCLSLILRHFVEVPGGIDLETMSMSLMAALQPTTYVHSLSVAELAAALTRHMLRLRPDEFIGMPGYDTREDVLAGASEIERYVYHAALCHDIGKLLVAETTMTYGRRLLEEEIKIIRTHPGIGAYLLEQHLETAPYVDVVRGHHRWFNNESGYPTDFYMEESEYMTAVIIVACADCLDAATDSVGRSYKGSKTLDDFIGELELGRGTRYAPYLPELLNDPEVHEEIERILEEGRRENYRKTYRLLKENAKSLED